jgi:hypothetical protein
MLPLWLPWLRQRLALTAEVERQLRAISPRQIDRRLWTHVRRLIGWDRCDSRTAVGLLNDLYRHELRLMMNPFQPSVKLLRKERTGSRLTRRYGTPRTPLDRLRAGREYDRAAVNALLRLRATTNPFELAQTIEKKLDRIAALARRPDRSARVRSQTA